MRVIKIYPFQFRGFESVCHERDTKFMLDDKVGNRDENAARLKDGNAKELVCSLDVYDCSLNVYERT